MNNKNNIFDKIDISKKLDSVVDIAIDEGLENLKKINLKKKRKRFKRNILAASTLLCILTGGLVFSNEDAIAGAKSMIEEFYKKVQGSFSDNIITPNQSLEKNNVKVYLDEAMINGNELLINIRYNYNDLPIDSWKITGDTKNFLKSLDTEIEDEKLLNIVFNKIFQEETITDIRNIEEIDYSKLENKEYYIENYNDYYIPLYTAMYEWGTSDSDFFISDIENPTENKNKKGAFPTQISLDGKDMIFYECVFNQERIFFNDLNLKINGQNIRWSEWSSELVNGKSNEQQMTIKFDISNIKDENLNIELTLDNLSLDMDYPVTQKGDWHFNFEMNKETGLKNQIIDVNKTIELGEYGNVLITNIEKTDASMKINYIPKLNDEIVKQNFTLFFDTYDAKTDEMIFKDGALISNNNPSEITYKISPKRIKLKPVLKDEFNNEIAIFDSIELDLE